MGRKQLLKWPTEILDIQRDGVDAMTHRTLNRLFFKPLLPDAEAVFLQIENLDLVAVVIDEHKQHGLKRIERQLLFHQQRQADKGELRMVRLEPVLKGVTA